MFIGEIDRQNGRGEGYDNRKRIFAPNLELPTNRAPQNWQEIRDQALHRILGFPGRV